MITTGIRNRSAILLKVINIAIMITMMIASLSLNLQPVKAANPIVYVVIATDTQLDSGHWMNTQHITYDLYNYRRTDACSSFTNMYSSNGTTWTTSPAPVGYNFKVFASGQPTPATGFTCGNDSFNYGLAGQYRALKFTVPSNGTYDVRVQLSVVGNPPNTPLYVVPDLNGSPDLANPVSTYIAQVGGFTSGDYVAIGSSLTLDASKQYWWVANKQTSGDTNNQFTVSEGLSSTISNVMDSEFRNAIRDSYGNSFKVTWFTEVDNYINNGQYINGQPGNYLAVYNEMVNNWNDKVQLYKDELAYYHAFMVWNGTQWVQSGQNHAIDGQYDDHNISLDHMILDASFYPTDFRSGWLNNDNQLQAWEEKWLLADFGGLGGGPAPIRHPYHPSPTNYNQGGNMNHWITNCWSNVPTQVGINTAFAQAQSSNGPVVYCWGAPQYNDLKANIASAQTWLTSGSATYGGITFKYVTAKEAMQAIIGTTDTTSPVLSITPLAGNNYTITSNEALWGSDPYVAVRYGDGTGAVYQHFQATPTGSYTWTVNIPQTNGSLELKQIGAGALDLSGNSAVATLTAPAPPVAVTDSYSISAGSTLSIATPGLLSNDTDVNHDPLTAVKVTDPANGTLNFNTNGSFTYTPKAGFVGSDSFTYKANDGIFDSNTVSVAITVKPISLDVPVLMYHSVRSDPTFSDYRIAPEDFAAQLDALQAYGYTTLSPDDYFAIRSGQMPAPAKPVMITFDDGPIDQYQNAYPLLQSHNMKALLNIITGLVETSCGPRNYWQGMCWNELISMDKTLITIGSHTVSHPDLSTLSTAQQVSELTDSKAALESGIPGYTVKYFAYPYGIGTNIPNVQQTLVNDNYVGAFSVYPPAPANTATSPVYDIPRMNVEPYANVLDNSTDVPKPATFFLRLLDPAIPLPNITINSVKAYDSTGVEQTTFTPGQTVTVKVNAGNSGSAVNTMASLALDVDQDNATASVYNSHPANDVVSTPFPVGTNQEFVFTWTIPVNANLGSYYDKFSVLDQSGYLTYKASIWQPIFTIVPDVIPPTVTINQAVGQVDPTNASPVNFTVVFSEQVTGFTGSDVSLSGTAGATTATVTGSGTTYTVAVSGMTTSGTIIASIPASKVTDLAGNPNLASTSTDNTVTYDNTAPTVTIEQAVGQVDPTNTSPVNFTVVFSKPVTGFIGSDVSLSGTAGATTATVTGSGTTYTVAVSGMTTSGTIIASIPAGAAQDTAGNSSTASTSTDNTVSYDVTAPTVTIDQAIGQVDPTNASPVNFTVVFSEQVTGFTGSDVSLSGTAGATTATVTGSGTTYTVAVSGMTTSGTIIASIPASKVTDLAGNPNLASTSTDNTVTYDNTAPTVTIEQAVGQVDPTNTSPVNFTVVFSKPVTGFIGSDVSLSGTAGATTATVTGSGTTYTVAVSGMTTSGTIIASIPASKVTDLAGNPNLASTSTDNTVTYDNTAPTVTIEQAVGQVDPTNTSPVNFTVVFSKPVTGFDSSDVTLGGTAGATTASVTGSGTTYTVAVSGMTGDGTIIASIPAGAAQDTAGNSSTASTSTDNTVSYDVTAPTVTIDQAIGQVDPTNSAPINFTVMFSEPVAGFTSADVALSGTAGATTAVISGSGASYSVAVSGMTNGGTVIASIPAGETQDLSGNGNSASTSTDNTVVFDNALPTVTINQAVGQTDPTNISPITFTATFSKPVTGFTSSSITLGGTAGANTVAISGTGPTYTITVSGMTTNGTVTVSIPAGVVQDSIGNGNSASTSIDNSVYYDTLPPSVTIEQAVGQADPTNASPIAFAVVFSEPVSGFTSTDVTLGGTAGATTAAVSGSGTTYTVLVSGMTGDGTITASIPAGAAQDAAGNASLLSASSDNSVVYDHTAPTVQIGLSSLSNTSGGPVSFPVVIGGATSINLTVANITLNTTGDATGTVTVTNGTTANPMITISSITGNGTLGISIGAGVAQDDASNTSSASGPSSTFTVDNIAPWLTIASPSVSVTNTGPIDFPVTITGANIVNLTNADVTLNITGTASGTIAVANGNTSNPVVTISGISGNGTLGISIANGVATDAAGNVSAAAGPSALVAVDNIAPVVTLGAPSISLTAGTPVSFDVSVTGADTVNLTNADVNLVTTGTATGTVSVAGGTTANPIITVNGISGNGTIAISIAPGIALDLAGNTSAQAGPSTAFTVDNAAPIITIDAPSTSLTIDGPVTFPVTISGADTVNLTAAAVSLQTTGSATATVSVSNGTTSSPVVKLSSISGDGTLRISIAAGVASDTSGNLSAAAGPSAIVNVDNTAPQVISIVRSTSSPTNATSASFTVTFDSSVTGLSASNFTLATIGITGASISNVNGSGSTYSVTVNTGSGDGVLGLNLTNSTGLSDAAGNPVSNAPFNGETYSVVKTNPVVLSITRADANPTTATSVTFTVTLSKVVTGLSVSNFDLVENGVCGASITSVNGSGTSYTVVVGDGTCDGTVGLNMTNTTSVTDSTGNALGNVPFTGEVYKIDLTSPIVIPNGINSTPDSGDGHIDEMEIVTVGVTQISVTFNEDVNNTRQGAGPKDVTNPANYILVSDNGDGIQTNRCSIGVTGGDIAVAIDSVTYSNNDGKGPFVATINVNGGNALPNGIYRLIVCGTTSITDLAGNELAGDGTSPRTDFLRNFVMAAVAGGNSKKDSQAKANNLSGLAVPVTGFAPGIKTILPPQSNEKAYAAYSGLVLEIPRLGIKLDIVGVPQLKDGWDVSWLGKQAGYLSGSAFPTTAGNAVITAHVWDALNNPGPFFNLKTLSYGDKILIHAWGKVFTYEVRSQTRILPGDINTVMKHEDLSWVSLVTCENFSTKTNSYSYRRLVRAILVSVETEK